VNLVSEVILQPRQVQQVILTFRPSEPLSGSSKEKDEKDIKQVRNLCVYFIHREGDCFTLFQRADIIHALYRLQDKMLRECL
jgi:hypothetical protein